MTQRLNIELFKLIREKIATTPESYDQHIFGRYEPAAPCGTAACIAGWACALSGRVTLAEVQRANPHDQGDADAVYMGAKELLGLSDEQAEILFSAEPDGEWSNFDDEGNDVYVNAWPEPFGSQWRETAFESEVAVAFLDHIISTGKVLE